MRVGEDEKYYYYKYGGKTIKKKKGDRPRGRPKKKLVDIEKVNELIESDKSFNEICEALKLSEYCLNKLIVKHYFNTVKGQNVV